MDIDLLEKLGKIAGIAGIAFGAFFLIFRSIIQKNIFPRLDRQQGFKIINTMILMASILAVLGLGSWIFLEVKKNESNQRESLSSKDLVGIVKDEQGTPISSVTVEVTQFPSIREYSDNDGKFVVALSGKGSKYIDLVLNHRDHQLTRKKVKIDYDAADTEIDLGAIRVRRKLKDPPNPEPVQDDPIKKYQIEDIKQKPVDPPTSTTSITLLYAGDPYGCYLDLVINIAGQTIKPTSNSIVMDKIPLGNQPYSINGTISCATIGVCNTSGRGNISIEEHSVYNLMWNNDNFAHCTSSLVGQDTYY